MSTLSLVNFIIAVVFTVCYAYQFLYIPIPWIDRLMRRKLRQPEKTGECTPDSVGACQSPSEDYTEKFAILICARNEAAVIGDLIGSISNQTYPSELIHVFVMADNCTDGTAYIAAANGATVYLRNDKEKIGKGYALDALMGHIKRDYPEGFDGYFVFDADNILAEDYIEQMRLTFAEGYDIVTSYRNSKNYSSSWISAGYALWFLRESRYLNNARHILHTSCAVSGTGFMFSRKLADELDGWPFHMLTEDIEFSAYQITHGRKIAFCEKAELFDEQPVTLRQSVRQRMRWAKGYLQVFRGYGGALVKGMAHGSFSCFDMSMNIMPAFILSAVSVISNLTLGIWGAAIGDDVMIAVRSIGQTFLNMYLMLFVIGAITTVTEWKKIHTVWYLKIYYAFTFPLFMLTYIPISLSALFAKVTWKPIEHSLSRDMLRDSGIFLPYNAYQTSELNSGK